MREFRSGGVRAAADLVAAILMTVVAIVFIAVAAQSYLRDSPSVNGASEPPLPDSPVSLEGAVLAGCQSSRVGVIVYGDFECQACRAFAGDTLPLIRRRYVEHCELLLAFRNLPIVARHRSAVRAAEAAACAGRQSRFWPMHDLLFHRQGTLDGAAPHEMANLLGLDQEKFRYCLEHGLSLPQIRLDAGEAVTLGVSATPTLLFGTLEAGQTVKVVRRVGHGVGFAEFADIVDGLLGYADVNATVR